MQIGKHRISFRNGKLYIDNRSIEFDEAYIIWRLVDNLLQNPSVAQDPVTYNNKKYMITVDFATNQYLIYRGNDPSNPELIFEGDQIQLSVFSFFLSRILNQGISLWLQISNTAENIDNTMVANQPAQSPEISNQPYGIEQPQSDSKDQSSLSDLDDQRFKDAIMYLHGLYTAYKTGILNPDRKEMLDRTNEILNEIFGLDITITPDILRSYLSYVDSVLGSNDPIVSDNDTIKRVIELFNNEPDETKKKGYKAVALFLTKAEQLAKVDVSKLLNF